jgi:hypothetical protein
VNYFIYFILYYAQLAIPRFIEAKKQSAFVVKITSLALVFIYNPAMP